MRCILPDSDGAPAGYSHFTLNGRPFKVGDAVCTRLAEAAAGEHRRVTRDIFIALCQLFREEKSGQNFAEPPGVDKKGYGQGWEDAHAMVYGLAIKVLGGPLYNNVPQPEPSAELVDGDAKPFVMAMRTIVRSVPESLAEMGHSGNSDRGRQQKLSEGLSGNPGPSSPDRESNVEKTEPTNADKMGSTRMAKDDKEQRGWLEEALSNRFSSGPNDEIEEDSMSLASQASNTPINTPSAVSISNSVLRALATPPLSASPSSSRPSPSTPNCSKPSRCRPGQPDGSLKRSEIIRGLDTTALLTHFERQSRLAERRIVAELARTSILRQAILQDRFFGRVPSFVGTPDARDPVEGRSGADDDDDDDDDDNEVENAGVTNGINDPFLGEAQQDRAVKEVKTLFRQWRKAAADATMDAGVLDEGIRTTEEGEEDDNSTRPVEDSMIPYLGSEVPIAGRGENATVPSPGSESVYSSDGIWLTGSPQRFTASPERFDVASPPMSPCMQRQYRLMIDHFASRNAYSSSSSSDSDHGH
ncbi:hypothetical protein CDEST_15152 [Colletotrichum destructivum]|uniref:Uncharacterized protein n=1 Tax=Colletotrichum destructivum TaxID=34406 RepID=A0AAX4J432_9PEZI|nr:hypothetical protein CDEST_15152 [Colletotrichum destructivum]